MQLHITTNDGVPPYLQIVNQVKYLVASGRLAPGEELPPIRALAFQLRINPNTVARAYQRLTEGGVLSVKRGEGTYVADEPPVPRKAERNEALRDAATRYASTAIAVGSTLDDAVDELTAAYDRVVREHRRKA